ncbi:uncharacterized protein EI90DRAFT_3064243 [Cantharellus anzutake]|uniref:uncharacterized protein n=1 Tax=Cantharellus anzutake TaxID=1750568 RepID=UPI001904C18D|nr:uncharacterized protein EI90DRAFT_3064243 [Cantharellus anzutake]KAF8328683.1 hypothetical protein EI90DRAFT_3064243 [Cantharellus anzutake]
MSSRWSKPLPKTPRSSLYAPSVTSAGPPAPTHPRPPTVEEIPDEGSPKFKATVHAPSPKPPPVIDLEIPSPPTDITNGYSSSQLPASTVYQDQQQQTLAGNMTPPFRPFASPPDSNIDEVLSSSLSSQERLERTQRRALTPSKSALRRGRGPTVEDPIGSVPPSSFRYGANGADDVSDQSKGPLHVANPDPQLEKPRGLVRFRLAGLVVKGVRRFSQGPASALARSASMRSAKSSGTSKHADQYKPVDIDVLHAGPGGLFEPDPDHPLKRMMSERIAQRASDRDESRHAETSKEPGLPSAATAAEVQPDQDPIPSPEPVEQTVRPGEDDVAHEAVEPQLKVAKPSVRRPHARTRSYRAYRRASYLPVKREPRTSPPVHPAGGTQSYDASASDQEESSPVAMADPAAYPSQPVDPSEHVSRFRREPVGLEIYEGEDKPRLIKSRFGPVGRFFKAVWALPWRSRDHVTVTYIPGKVRRGEVVLGEPWYRAHASPNRYPKPNQESSDSSTDSNKAGYVPAEATPATKTRTPSVSRPQVQGSRSSPSRVRPAYQTSIPRPPPHRQMSAITRARSATQSTSTYSHSHIYPQLPSRPIQPLHQNVDPTLPIQVYAQGQMPLHVAPPGAVPINVSGPPIDGQSPPPSLGWLTTGVVPSSIVASSGSIRRRHTDKAVYR